MRAKILGMRRLPGRRRMPVGEIQTPPFDFRAFGADATNYDQPIPLDFTQYQTFWAGNQLPSVAIGTAPHAWYMRYAEAQPTQRAGGNAGGPWLGSVATAGLVERMRAAWQSVSAPYVNNPAKG